MNEWELAAFARLAFFYVPPYSRGTLKAWAFLPRRWPLSFLVSTVSAWPSLTGCQNTLVWNTAWAQQGEKCHGTRSSIPSLSLWEGSFSRTQSILSQITFLVIIPSSITGFGWFHSTLILDVSSTQGSESVDVDKKNRTAIRSNYNIDVDHSIQKLTWISMKLYNSEVMYSQMQCLSFIKALYTLLVDARWHREPFIFLYLNTADLMSSGPPYR